MLESSKKLLFSLYERRRLRNWYYTLAFLVVVPIGLRFALVAWEHGSWFDKPLTILGGTVIGLTSVMTVLRMWEVPPVQTMRFSSEASEDDMPIHELTNGRELVAGIRAQALRNRIIARDAASLGLPRRIRR